MLAVILVWIVAERLGMNARDMIRLQGILDRDFPIDRQIDRPRALLAKRRRKRSGERFIERAKILGETWTFVGYRNEDRLAALCKPELLQLSILAVEWTKALRVGNPGRASFAGVLPAMILAAEIRVRSRGSARDQAVSVRANVQKRMEFAANVANLHRMVEQIEGN